MRTMISDILAQAGYEIVGEAETGAQAVDKYKQLKPELVTMDIVMPDMGGIDAVREIVKYDPDAKILMCTASSTRDGWNGLTTKSFAPAWIASTTSACWWWR